MGILILWIKQNNFTKETASDAGLEFFDFKLKIVEGKTKVDIFVKPAEGKGYET